MIQRVGTFILFGLFVSTMLAAEQHWSFRPMKNAVVLGDTHPVDFFVSRKLSEKKLRFSVEANRTTLLRRVTLDLTGLPPTSEAVQSFTQDKRNTDSVFVETVDALLASPRYGERWAQHWLDVIRWAETVGFETNLERPNAWHYRDWVIHALNSDLPYDQFIRDQLAGDITGADAALGFLVSGPANLPGQVGRDEEAMRSARQDELDEVIRTVGQSMLGLTLGCARCHEHKFDPVTMRDYYGLQAIFAGLRYGDRRLRGEKNDRWAAQLPAARKRLGELGAKLEGQRLKFSLREPLANVHSDEFAPVTASAIRMNIDATANGSEASLYEFEAWTTDGVNAALASGGAKPSASSFALANQTRHFENLTDGSVDRRQAFPWVSAKGGAAWLRVDFAQPVALNRITWHNGSSVPVDYTVEVLQPDDGWQTVVHTWDRLPRGDDTRAAGRVTLKNLTAEQTQVVVTLIAEIRRTEGEISRLAEGPQAYAASFSAEPGPTWLLRRGDPLQRLAKVAPAIPVALGQEQIVPDAPEPQRRLALAGHLTRWDHPLTARVLVNRVWQHHFGIGLVGTPSDFGKMGAAPTHPELLDWLALEFVRQGWSLKKLHRRIVTSRTYRQASRPNPEALRVDAASRLLWRFPPRRLEAEAIRDGMLFVSGRINLRMGGPGFDFFNQRGGLSDYIAKQSFDDAGSRRMIYAHKIRMQAVDIFGAFDCPDAGLMKPSRTRSITPVQSLSLLNSPFANRQAAFFARRVQREAGDNPGRQIDRAFRLACARDPKPGEQQVLLQLAREHGLEQVCRVLFNSSAFLYLR
ncbi:MAG TPA: DUF1549 and DUF1553 domain-containing protein [Verrucomicrobiota bacterium]|nr:DUF1549 and DUF1553 domain-containing protein [Verrucomicrobiota bacterium]